MNLLFAIFLQRSLGHQEESLSQYLPIKALPSFHKVQTGIREIRNILIINNVVICYSIRRLHIILL